MLTLPKLAGSEGVFAPWFSACRVALVCARVSERRLCLDKKTFEESKFSECVAHSRTDALIQMPQILFAFHAPSKRAAFASYY
jgi:hypothetical protein